MSDKPEAILVTGCCGLIGSNFVKWILKNKPEYYVVGVDDLSGGYLENLPPQGTKNFMFVNMDCGDSTIESVFKTYNIVYITHYSAYAAEGLSPFIRCFNYRNNLVASANLINFAIKYNVKRFLFTSSMAVYGHSIPPFSEELKPNPADPYGIAKYAVEMDLKIAGEQHGLDWCVVRPHNVYGEGQVINDKYRNVLGIFMWKYLNNQPFSIYGDGTQTRAFTYIDDILEPLWNALTKPEASKQIINLGGIYEITIIEAANVLRHVIEETGGHPSIEFLEPRHEVHHAYSTYQKSVDLLGFKHSTGLQKGLSIMWDWAVKQPNRPQTKWESYELDKGIYNYWKV